MDAMVTHHFALDQTQTAFDLVSDPSQFVDAVKALSEVDQTGVNNVASLEALGG